MNPPNLHGDPIQPVILCGGAGSRLWPLSRAAHPKPFLEIGGRPSLFAETLRRLQKLSRSVPGVQAPIIVGNEAHCFQIRDQLQAAGIHDALVVLEPAGRNTAPALTLAALAAAGAGDSGNQNPGADGLEADPILLVTPADQAIGDDDSLVNAWALAAQVAEGGAIALLGAQPDRPETGYGYIRCATPVQPSYPAAVESFVEKPDSQRAAQLIAQGNHFWHAGMVALRSSLWQSALARYQPALLQACQAAWQHHRRDRVDGHLLLRPNAQAYGVVTPQSIDRAVLEHCTGDAFEVRMVPLNGHWDDLGAWDAVWRAEPKDGAGNAANGDVILHDSRNNLVHSGSRLVSLVGVDDLVVVETPDAVLVARRDRSQAVGDVVSRLQAGGRQEPEHHRKEYRPWGWYDGLDDGHRFRVKRIQVRPLASLSLQKHHHRAEHWIVVRGTAEIRRGQDTLLLTENQSTYIPVGEVHRLTNPGAIPLEIIEVQSGSYLGEDDIIRLEDEYGR